MSKLVLKGIELPDAFFCANDEMAWGCIRALASMGIKVPDKVSVIGFDDMVLPAHYNPALTTVRSPVVELGSDSAIELIRLVRKEGDPVGKLINLEATLVVRDSSKLRI